MYSIFSLILLLPSVAIGKSQSSSLKICDQMKNIVPMDSCSLSDDCLTATCSVNPLNLDTLTMIVSLNVCNDPASVKMEFKDSAVSIDYPVVFNVSQELRVPVPGLNVGLGGIYALGAIDAKTSGKDLTLDIKAGVDVCWGKASVDGLAESAALLAAGFTRSATLGTSKVQCLDKLGLSFWLIEGKIDVDTSKSCSHGLHKILLIVIILGIGFILVAITMGICFLCRRRRKARADAGTINSKPGFRLLCL